jgi:hypothetical protein
MPEIDEGFPREWLEFQDPANSLHLFKCDMTWLTSSWNCIYGSGCKGIDKESPDSGCCSDGAYYSDKDDEKRVLAAAARLTPDIWQMHGVAYGKAKVKLSISEIGLDDDRKTKRVDGSCIFLNRAGFEGGMGCALHHLAVREGVHFHETKPDVCWQLPLRRSFEKREMGDAELTVTVIGEYGRMAWGEGGADMDWYCTSNTEAHNGSKPVYLSSKEELIQMMGLTAYGILAKACDKRMALISKTKKQLLPLFTIHPATVGAKAKLGR